MLGSPSPRVPAPGPAERAALARGGENGRFNRAVEIVLAVRAPAYILMHTPRAAVSINQVPPLRDRDLECNPLEVGGDEADRPRSEPSCLPPRATFCVLLVVCFDFRCLFFDFWFATSVLLVVLVWIFPAAPQLPGFLLVRSSRHALRLWSAPRRMMPQPPAWCVRALAIRLPDTPQVQDPVRAVARLDVPSGEGDHATAE
jgi:hypothetical protein